MLPRPSLLVIEDDTYAQRLVGAVAERAGFAVTSAGSGAAAEHAADRVPFDIIIADLKLPDVEGFDLIERLRNKPHLQGVPFLICSGNVTVDNVTEARRLGALQFIRKPIDMFELQRRLEKTQDILTDRWIHPEPSGRRTPQRRQQDAELLAHARASLASVIELLDKAHATDASEAPETDEASLNELLKELTVAGPEIGAPKLTRLVTETAEAEPRSERRRMLHVALRVALTSLDQRLAG